MQFRGFRTATAAVLAAGLMSACQHNPYATSVSNIAYDLPEKPAAVTVSDPKLYRREALINERTKEVGYLKDLLDKTNDLTFAPEVIRDLQTVTALSAAAGLKFDPSAALGYKQQRASAARQQETSDLQQQIDVMKLQLQLDQLKTDASLLRKGLADQTAVSDTTLGKAPATPSTTTPATASPPVTIDTATQLTAAIDALKSSLQTTLAVASTKLEANGATANPIDTFRDRLAYRDVVKAAINAQSLDELHDKDGSALMRLSFEATVFPPQGLAAGAGANNADYARSLAFLHMQIVQPDWKPGQVARVYREWLSYVNRSFDIWNPDTKRFDLAPELEGVSGSLFDPVYFRYRAPGAKPPDPPAPAAPVRRTRSGKPAAKVVAPTAPPPLPPVSCEGLEYQALADTPEVRDHKVATADCLELVFAVPRLRQRSFAEGLASRAVADAPLPQSTQILEAQIDEKAQPLSMRFADATAAMRASKGCDPKQEPLIRSAAKLHYSIEALAALELQARAKLAAAGLTPPNTWSPRLTQLMKAAFNADLLLAEVRNREAAVGGRSASTATSPQASINECKVAADTEPYVPPRFERIVKDSAARVSVYEVAPRELVQQISTSARAAEAIGLAAALSGQVPRAGLGFDGNIAYSRSATGRADARERAPLVISFAEPHGVANDLSATSSDDARSEAAATGQGDDPPPAKAASLPGKKKAPAVREARYPNTKPSFGWIMGPSATLDAKSEGMVLEHRVKPYDLSVDLSVPGWWPYFDLETTSGWAPHWWAQPSDILKKNAGAGRLVRVQMSPNAADMAAFTSLLSGDSVLRLPIIRTISPHTFSPCAGIQVQLAGDYVWRASKVIIGNRVFSDSQINVLPDLGGVLVNLDAQAMPLAEKDPNNNRYYVTVTALTPYGPATGKVEVVNLKADGTCKAPEDPKPNDPGGGAADPADATPTISDIDPLQLSTCAAAPAFRVLGEKLAGVTAVTLAGVPGKIGPVGTGGKSLGVSFDGKTLRSSLAGLAKAPLVLTAPKGSYVRKDIDVANPEKCPA